MKTRNENKTSAEDKALEMFTNMMIEKIETINEDWHKPWFTEGCAWPKNLYGREYGGMNAFMLMVHSEKNGYKIPVFCTFDTVKYLNFTKVGDQWKRKQGKDGIELPKVFVNKGEKSFPIFLTTYTVVHKETKERIKWETYKTLSDDEKQNYNVYPSTVVYHVFNVDQTNMKEARSDMYAKLQDEYSAPSNDKEMYSFEPLDEMIYNGRWLCPINTAYQDKAYYRPSTDEILLPMKEQFQCGEDFYGTALHEMVHSTGAKNRLNRLANTKDKAEYAREELVAEMGAALVATHYGMAKHIKEDSAAYLKNWLAALHETPKFIKTVLYDVKKASSMIIENVDAVTVAENEIKSVAC